MKGILRALLLALLLLPAVAAAEDTALPDAVRTQIASDYPEYTLESYCAVPDAPEGGHMFALVKSAGERRLLGFRLARGEWGKWLDASGPVPQQDLQAVLYRIAAGDEFDVCCGCGEYQRTFVSDGRNIGVLLIDEEVYDETAFYVWRDDSYYLSEFSRHTVRFVDILGDDMVFSNICNGYDGAVKYLVDTDIRSVSLESLPCSLEELPAAADGVPIIPYVESGFPGEILTPQDVRLPAGRQYPVYAGPGTAYGRSGGGKAVVSTNGWVQVFGQYDGWLLIQYGLDEERCRIGWISARALPAGATVKRLAFDAKSRERRTLPKGGSVLTDDPLGAQTPATVLKGKVEIEKLAQLGLNWMYVRVHDRGRTRYGFLPLLESDLDNG